MIRDQAEAEQLLEWMEIEQADYLRAVDEALDWLLDASQLYLAGTPAVHRRRTRRSRSAGVGPATPASTLVVPDQVDAGIVQFGRGANNVDRTRNVVVLSRQGELRTA